MGFASIPFTSLGFLVGGVGIIGATGAISALTYKDYKFRKEDYYKLSVAILKDYPPAMKLLGPPVKSTRIKVFGGGGTYSDGYTAKLTIPVQGSRRTGKLYSWASRHSIQESWLVDKCDIEVEGRRWTFYINPKSKRNPVAFQDMKDGSAAEPDPVIISRNVERNKRLLLDDDGP